MLRYSKSKSLILGLLLVPMFLGSNAAYAGLWERLSNALTRNRTQSMLAASIIGAAATIGYVTYRIYQARRATPPAEPAAEAAPMVAIPAEPAAEADPVAVMPAGRATENLLTLTGAIHRTHLRPNLDRVNALIRAGADLAATSSRNRTALWFACNTTRSYYQPALAELLIRKGADINIISEGTSLLALAAVAYHNAHLTKLLLQAGVVSDSSLATNELVLSAQAELALIPPLIAALSPITPAQTAAMPQLLTDLIANGKDVNESDAHGITPLMALVENSEHPNTLAMIDQLIAAGANVNAQDHNGLTALHHIFKRQVNTTVPVYKTQENGAVVPVYVYQVVTPAGAFEEPEDDTAAAAAEARGQRVHKCEPVLGLQRNWDLIQAILEQLIRHGANIHLINTDGQTPYVYALEQCCSTNPAENLPSSISRRFIAAGALDQAT